MCGRYTLLHQQWVESVFGADLGKLPDSLRAPRYNVAPGQIVLALSRAGAAPVAEAMHWGIEPNWRGGPSQLINARAEKLGESRFWRPLLEDGRCAIPADGFYEWRAAGGGPKQPYWFSRADGEGFAFAGLCRRAEGRDESDELDARDRHDDRRYASGAGTRECVIVTVDANELVAAVHDRMPAMLDSAGVEDWLGGDADEALAALRPLDSVAISARAVSTAVNEVANDGPRLLAAVPPDDEAESRF